MRAVVIGAGRIGLGFAAQIAADAGLDVVVLGRGPVLQQIARHGRVVVRLTDGRTRTDHSVPIADVVDTELDPDGAVEQIAAADLVCTAVGADHVQDITGLLTAGLARARHSIDVIAFENLEDAGARLRTGVEAGLPTGGPQHGFSGAVVDRVMAHRLRGDATTPVTLIGEPVTAFAVDRTALTRDWSQLPGIVQVDDFRAWFRRKLHRYSSGHATAAYLGRLKGYQYLHSAVVDPEIADAVLGAMEEGRLGLRARYGDRVAGTTDELEAILARFANPALGDTTARVGRDVPRKVARGERLVGAARGALNAGVVPQQLVLATAAALCRELPGELGTWPQHVTRLTGLPEDSRLARLITTALDRVHPDVALLSLRDGTPAWVVSDTLERVS